MVAIQTQILIHHILKNFAIVDQTKTIWANDSIVEDFA